jgi:hypothetical protein
MDGSQFIQLVVRKDIEKRIDTLGFTGYQLSVAVKAIEDGQLKFINPEVNLALPSPQTVRQLLTYGRSLHPRHLIEKDDHIIAQTFMLAESIRDRPLGVVQQETAIPILTDMRRLTEAVKELPAGRSVDDPFWANEDYSKLIHLGEAFRTYKEAYGGTTFQERLKPGPEPRTMEEVIELVDRWRKWKNNGHSQQEFCERQGWESRTILSNCIKRYRAKFGSTSI